MRQISTIATMLFFAGLALRCASTDLTPVAYEERIKFQRIALVCAPAPGHEPLYAKLIAKEADMKVASRLGRYIEKAVVLYDVPIDTTVSPPKVSLDRRASEYDGVVVLVYSYGNGMVNFDIDMIDVKTGKSVWHHQLAHDDPNISGRLVRNGMWTPTIVKKEFYGF
jgi:hypothetical protein